MLAYIKRWGDFSLARKENVESYSIPAATVTSETGTVVLAGYDDTDHSGDWMYICGQLVLISKASPKDDKVTLSVADPVTAFDRALIWPDTPAATYGGFIAAVLQSDYIACADSAYALSYITVSNSDATALVAPELDDTKRYTLADIMTQARRVGVIIDFGITTTTTASDTLTVSISTADASERMVVFSDGHAQLSSETYSAASVAKVTVMQETEQEDSSAEPVYTNTDFFLAVDGSISTSIPQSRASGRWKHITCKSDDDPAEQAAAVFAANISSHKIEFYSDRVYGLYDTVLLRLNGAVFKSQIVYIGISSSDDRYLYKCGELAVTLQDKVRSASGGTAVYKMTVAGGGSALDMYPVGAVYISTAATSPASLFGGTWEQLKDRFLLAAGDSYAAGATGGEAAHTLTVGEMPAHEGHLGGNNSSSLGNYAAYMQQGVLSAYGASGRGWSLQDSNEAIPAGMTRGGGGAHNNMPPYLAVYVWRRTA
ncbi:MAG: hypothetical protein VB039_03190 [Oscillospiraceae bacterium]|nr:hypothetical protein [Oscillospiraceae bacterium]